MRPSLISSVFALATPITAQGDLLALLRTQPDLSTLASLIQLTGLNTTLSTSSNITIVAPTNAAFDAIPRNIPEGIAVQNRNSTTVAALLSNHVFQGFFPSSEISNVPTFARTLVNSTFFNDEQPFSGFTNGQPNGLIKNGDEVDVLSGELSVSRVVEADIPLGPGIIIHKISTALSFGPPLSLYLARAGLRAANGAFTSVDIGLNFELLGADQSGDNVTDLTYFIPNDAAFENIASVLGSANESALQEVLKYHVLRDQVIFSPDVTNGSYVTAQGGMLETTVTEDGEIFINGAKVLFPNIILFNGVGHIIDQVLNPLSPPSRNTVDFSAPAAERVQFANATSSSVLPFTTFAFSEEFQNPYTTAALLTTLQAVEVEASATSSSEVAVCTGGVRGRVVEVVKVVVAVGVGVGVGGVLVGGL